MGWGNYPTTDFLKRGGGRGDSNPFKTSGKSSGGGGDIIFMKLAIYLYLPLALNRI